MNRAELALLVADYAHRLDLLPRIESAFIPLAESRIGRTLKSIENETVQELTPAESPFDLPTDYGSIRALSIDQNRGPHTLVSLDLHTINNWARTGGQPRFYAIAAGQVDVRPFVAGTFNFFYYFKPLLPEATSENAVLDAWPNVYIFATLVELNIWTQDKEQRELNLGLYDGEIREINRNAERGRGEKPAMRRA